MSDKTTSTASVRVGLSGRDVDVIGRRILACLVDCSLALALSSPALLTIALIGPGLVLALILLLIFIAAWCAVYLAHAALLEGYTGQTLGKRLFVIEAVRREDGGVPGPGRAALRALMFLSADMIAGVFVMSRSPERQRPGDMAANTLVVRKTRGSG